ncbi:MAG: hypothetical protein AAFX05_03185 [Planctomycetota bacterium]
MTQAPVSPMRNADAMQRVRHCVEVLSSRGINLEGHLEGWASQFDPTRDHSHARRAAMAVDLPCAAADGSHSPAAPAKPIVVEGLHPATLFDRVVRATGPLPDGYAAAVLLVQEDPIELLNGLATLADPTVLDEERISVFIGPGAGDALAAHLEARLHLSLPELCLRSPGLGLMSPTLESVLRTVHARQRTLHRELLGRVDEVYSARDEEFWSTRFDRAISGDHALRVLMPVSRYSTFVRHAADDLHTAFAAAGHELRILTEPDDHHKLASVAYLRECAEWTPDLIVMINFMRSHLGHVLPANVPCVCWVQDQMAQLYQQQAGASQGPLDFIAGNLTQEMFRDFGYPRQRVLPIPVVASPAKFHPARTEEDAGLVCDIAYVSHQSQPVDAMHTDLMARVPRQSPLFASLQSVLPRLQTIVAASMTAPLSLSLRCLAQETLASALGVSPDPRAVAELLNQWIGPLAERVLRHETLGWAAEICSENGWTMKLFGRGWEQHPVLSPFAAGELAHGDMLRASYQHAGVHLHMSTNGAVHQRVLECALSGGMPACRITMNDVVMMETVALARIAVDATADLHHLPSSLDYCAVVDHPELLAYQMQRQRLGLEASAWSPLYPDFAGGGYVIAPEASPGWLLGDLDRTAFTDRASMERLIRRMLEDREERSQLSAAIARRARTSLSHDALAQRLVKLVATGLRPPPRSPAL